MIPTVTAAYRRLVLLVAFSTLPPAAAHAQPSSRDAQAANGVAVQVGTIEGRVFDRTTGNALRSALVVIVGTNIQAFTDEEGSYRITRVPAGARRVEVSYAGLTTKTEDLAVAAQGVVRRDFTLDNILRLAPFTVEATQLTQQGVALQEQKTAPNIKAVIPVDHDLGEGNVGEYFKYSPGLVMAQNPQSPSEVSIRGMPSMGTLILSDGAQFATASMGSRAVDLGLAAPGNVDRIEITKTPTPDLPANAVGGSINLVTKTAFSRKQPQLDYNVFGTYTSLGGFRNTGNASPFERLHGGDPKTVAARVQPNVNLSYLHPISDSLGATLSFSRSVRLNDWLNLGPTWNQKTVRLENYRIWPLQIMEGKMSASAKVEWKVGNHTLAGGYSYANQRSATRSNSLLTSFGANSVGDQSFVETTGTGGYGQLIALVNNNQYKDLQLVTLTDKYRGRVWTVDGGISRSTGRFDFKDKEDGFFNQHTANFTGIRPRGEFYHGALSRVAPKFTAVNTAGDAVDIFNSDNYTLVSVQSTPRWIDDELRRAYFNASREIDVNVPLTIKFGGAFTEQARDDRNPGASWSFAPPAGVSRLVRDYDLLSDPEAASSIVNDVTGRPIHIRYLSTTKIKRLFDQRPEYFVWQEAAAWQTAANNHKVLEETIAAAYLRADAKFFQNRLWVVGGVRFEETRDEGRGVRNDLRATYQQDANGNLILNPAGQPIRVTTNAVELAKLQYTPLGTRSKYSYSGYYPSMNASYTLSDLVVFRAGYARTIGRPDLPNIIPGVTIPAPSTNPNVRGVINVVETRLNPWMADNYDLTAEVYRWKGAVASVSLYRKEIDGFFVRTRTEATPELLARVGMTDDYIDYDLSFLRNSETATTDGVELSYRQDVGALVPAAKGFHVFGNMALMAVKGRSANDFTGFSPKTISGGIAYARSRVRVDLRCNYVDWRRTGIAAESATIRANSYNYFTPQTKVDASLSYRFNKYATVYVDIRNLFDEPQSRGAWGADTVGYTRVSLMQYTGALFSFGVKGTF